MTTRYDCLSPRPGREGKTYWHKVGSAFQSRDGGMQVYLDSLPIPDEKGKVSFIIREAKAKDDALQHVNPPQRQPQRAAYANGRDPINDDVPFDK
jgi:hypothetical protein